MYLKYSWHLIVCNSHMSTKYWFEIWYLLYNFAKQIFWPMRFYCGWSYPRALLMVAQIYMEAFIACQCNMLDRLLPVSRNKAPWILFKNTLASLFVIQTDYMALPHLSSALGLSQRPWSHTLSLAGYLPLPRPRHSLQREQLEFECDHWCITFQFQCHPILEDCKWDEGRDEFSSLSKIQACCVLSNSAKELETTVDKGVLDYLHANYHRVLISYLIGVVECFKFF